MSVKQAAVAKREFMMLSELFSEEEMTSISSTGKITKRIKQQYEVIPRPEHFCQIVDIDINLKGNSTKGVPCMDGYPIRSVENAVSYIRQLLSSGIRAVTVRLGGNPVNPTNTENYSYDPLLVNSSFEVKSVKDYDLILAAHVEVFKELRNQFPKGTLHITGDPFGIAPNSDDGAWGIKRSDGKIDYPATLELIAKIATAYAGAGVDALLSLGRIEREVEVARKALNRMHLEVEIQSFSQNVESKAAYIYLDDVQRKKDSFQKILPGNFNEMNFRAITDIYEGSDTVVVKPTENLHIVSATRQFLNSKQEMLTFLTSQAVKDMIQGNEYLSSMVFDILMDSDAFFDKCRKVKLSTYTVSGTYYLHKLLEQQKGESFAFSVVDELYKNIISAAGPYFGKIMDRNAFWYIEQLSR